MYIWALSCTLVHLNKTALQLCFFISHCLHKHLGSIQLPPSPSSSLILLLLFLLLPLLPDQQQSSAVLAAGCRHPPHLHTACPRPRMLTLSLHSHLLAPSPMPDVCFFYFIFLMCLRNSSVLNLGRSRERMWREYIALSVLACANNNSLRCLTGEEHCHGNF